MLHKTATILNNKKKRHESAIENYRFVPLLFKIQQVMSLLLFESHQPANVFTQNIKFEVNNGPRLNLVKVGKLVGVGYYGH